MSTSTSSAMDGAAARIARDDAARYRIALALVISLFFTWGLAYGLLDVLNKHFQQTLNVTRLQSALLQTCYFAAYFLVAIPSRLFVSLRVQARYPAWARDLRARSAAVCSCDVAASLLSLPDGAVCSCMRCGVP